MRGSIVLILALLSTVAHGDLLAPATRPAILDSVGIDQRLGQRVPLDLSFVNDRGVSTTLAQCMHDRPVVLTPVYYNCPMLCTLTLNQLTRSLNMISPSAGQQFDIISFSFDPREGPTLAAEKKLSYLRTYRRTTADAGWHFLTGSEDSIRRLTDAIGFHYTWDEKNKVYAHASGIVVLTPDGAISRYFLGVDYPSIDMQQAIADASRDTIAPPAERIFLYCFHYDPATGRYGLLIDRAIRVLGLLTLLSLGLLIILNVWRERHRRFSDGKVRA